MAITLTLNGAEKTLDELADAPTVADLVHSLGFRQDRVALELNGEIVPRAAWAESAIASGDRVELVHFVGGGC